MGSNQSTSAPETVQISVDPSGNISYKTREPKTAESTSGDAGSNIINDDVNSKSPGQQTNHLDEPAVSDNLPPIAPAVESQPFIVLLAPKEPQAQENKEQSLCLEEADRIADNLRSKYKITEMAGKNRSIFEDLEKDLTLCYKNNKDQPIKCAELYRNYKTSIDRQSSQLLKKSMNVPLISSVLVIITCLLLHIATVNCFGAMSIDLGSESMKVGLVAPSVQMDIVLNAQSQRKTPTAIAFSNGERFLGDSALDIASKYPERAFTHFLDLVGKTIDHPSVEHYKRRFPYANITSHEPNSTSILLNHPEGSKYTPLELIAMMIQHAHDQVTSRLSNNEPAYDVVITVPPFFEAPERKVIEQAARLAGLNVLRLTNVNSAFALSYGIFRHTDYKPESSDPGNRTSVLFFDQGASHTSVTLADYHLVEQFDDLTGLSKNESVPTVTIRAQVFDRYFGGFDMQLRLRDYLVKAFANTNKIDEKRIMNRGKSAAKLLKESGRVKRVLSANTDFVVRVENVIDDKDMKLPISREEFEDMNKDYLEERITSLLDKLYEMPDVSRSDPLESVIIVGGNTRTPKVQQVLQNYFKLETIGKSINADEGAALSALYQAASLGRGFRVKRFALEEFGDERRRYDPVRAAEYLAAAATSTTTTTTTTTTPVPAEESTDEPVDGSTNASTEAPVEGAAENSTDEATETTSTEQLPVATPLDVEPPLEVIEDPNVIYKESELQRIRARLDHLRHRDHMRLQRLSLRNSLESIVSEAREKLSDDSNQAVIEVSDWLENGPKEERDNVTLLALKISELQNQLRPPPHTEL